MKTMNYDIHVGEYILDEVKARGRTQKKLAEMCGIGAHEVNDIIKGRRRLTVDLAKKIGEAFGTGGEVWMNLQTARDFR